MTVAATDQDTVLASRLAALEQPIENVDPNIIFNETTRRNLAVILDALEVEHGVEIPGLILAPEASGARPAMLVVDSRPKQSLAAPGVKAQQRTPITTDPRVRGSRSGRTLASGSYWAPARDDLDTMLSKIDSRLIQNVVVIQGPYAARYGPGFDFIDFQLLESPRYDDGAAHAEGSSSLEYIGPSLRLKASVARG